MPSKILSSALIASALATSAYGAPIQWEAAAGGNDHWYDFVILDTEVMTTDAEGLAETSVFGGSNGYLATITSAAEQSFLNSIWTGVGSVAGQFMDYSFFLIGASDTATEGDFHWLGGPEDGDALTYTNWSSGEPNNANGVEDFVVAWWQDSDTGLWNDIPTDSTVRAYVVEYDSTIAAVPLPAGLPLMLVALGGLLAIRRKGSQTS